MGDLIVYVDGFNLYNGLHDKYGHRYLWLDLVELARKLRPRDRLVQVKYFTAPVLNNPDAASRQNTYQRALRAQNANLIEIVQGRYQSKNMRCRGCGNTWTGYEEKETDVNIAVSLVADVATAAATSAMIISADSDLCPAIRMAQKLSPATHIIAAFPPARFSNEVKKLLPNSFVIGHGRLRSSLLPEDVIVPGTGAKLSRPQKWN